MTNLTTKQKKAKPTTTISACKEGSSARQYLQSVVYLTL